MKSKFFCPCCEWHFPAFLTVGVKPWPDAQCPICGSLERHRLLQIYLENKTTFFKDRLRVLDVAPIPSFQRRCKSLRNLKYVSADIKSPIAMLKFDITNIPLKEGRFDCMLCYHVLEHVPDDRKAMRELFRVLKPGGWAIMQSPIDYKRHKTFEDPHITSPVDRELYFGQSDHVRMYGKDYRGRLQDAGFVVKVDDYARRLRDPTIKKYGLQKDEKIYFCKRPK